MKKVLVFLLACLASTAMFAQTTHWTMVTGQGAAGTNTTMTGVLYIDHVIYENPSQLEIGVFDQNEICRGAKLPKFNNNLQKWIYQITIKGNEGFEYHFKIWDHATEMELDLVDDFGEVITWGSGKKYGSLANPYEINFTAPAAPCAVPTGLAVTDVSLNAVLSWTGSSESYNVQYKASTETDWTVISGVNGTTCTITELEGSTTYSVQVQGICDETQSDWSEALEFTTPAVIVWDEPGDWPSGEIPPAGGDVNVPDNTVVVVPDGYTANTGEITMGAGSSILIEENGQLYHTEEVEVTMEMNVPDGYTKNSTGWRLFACPVTATALGSGRPVEGTNLNTGSFDLYKFDQGATDGLEWINYKGNNYDTDNTDVNFADLTLMEGYLYANQNQSAGIVMRGYAAPTTSTSFQSTMLSKTAGAEFEGVNLVGNPYTCKAYVSNDNGDMPYYVMNDNGTGFNETAVAAGTPIYPMKAVFVMATTDGEDCYFKTQASSKSGSLNITVNQGRSMVDNAILSIGGANTLEKFQFDPNRTKVYIPQNGKDYAVVSAGEMGETPVNFKAESNGSYTMSFSSEEVSFNYLHLIDNLTGADVDLLATPYYTFDAKTTDYASRFKLVYATGDNTEDNFAFFSNGSFIISNEGEATLQVVDVMGRIVKSESINGSASVSVNAAAGVYMLRLVSANGEKVQKIVVK